jgi:hypothetical protein
MKGKRARWAIAAIFLLLAAGLVSCSNPRAQTAAGPSETVMTSCTACHPAKVICDALGKKDREAWNTTVGRMMGKGANVPQESVPDIVSYLAGLKPGSPPICK